MAGYAVSGAPKGRGPRRQEDPPGVGRASCPQTGRLSPEDRGADRRMASARKWVLESKAFTKAGQFAEILLTS